MKKLLLAAGLLVVVAVGYRMFDFSYVVARQQAANTALIERKMAEHVGTLAYIYGYPLVDMYQQQHNETHRVSSERNVYAPLNRFYRFAELVTPATSGYLRAPNADTLYFSGWYDISDEPVIIHVPNTRGRYYTIAVTNSYSEVEHLGRRTTGTEQGYFALVRPGWQGALPAGVRPFETETPTGWLLGRMLVDGPDDYPQAQALVDDIWMASLSEFTPGQRPPLPAEETASEMDILEELAFFEVMNTVMQDLPVRPGEEALLAQFATLGIGRGEAFDIDALSDATREGLLAAIESGREIVVASSGTSIPSDDGWIVLEFAGRYGFQYRERAMVVEGGYANRPEESIYPARILDNEGKALSGKHRYKLVFDAGELPDVNAFWSLSAYNVNRSRSLEPNALERYSLGDRTEGLRFNDDGSLEVLLQHEQPEDTANWLPTPPGLFLLVMRMYEPGEKALSRESPFPTLQRIE